MTTDPEPEVSPRAARAPLSSAVIASSEPVCPICGTVRGARLWMSACSDRCRAALSRRRKAEAQAARDAAILEEIEAHHLRVAELLQTARRR
jgi:hypothetical protein